MAKKKIKKSDQEALKFIGRTSLFIVKLPYYTVKGLYKISRKAKGKMEKSTVSKKRESLIAKYDPFKILKSEKGDYDKFENDIFDSDSKIGVILGSRGSGKTAFAVRFLENFHSKKKGNIHAIGFDEKEMPSWINVIGNISKIKNNSFILIDEGGVLFSSRNTMSNANKLLSELILIARHKNLNILFISQNSSNLDVNILRQADYLALKPSSLLQKDFERKIIQKLYNKVGNELEELEDSGVTYIYSDKFSGFISNSLPSFWGVKISKSFR